MRDSVDSGCPERRSALIAHELPQLNIDIAALSDVHLHEEGSFKEHGASCTLYWSGKPKTESHLSGVGFMIKTPSPPNSIYVPTLQADPVGKDKFYTDLRHLTQNVPADDKIIICGDLNARVGKNSEDWKGVLGKHGVGKCNDKVASC
ncbi:craniofacial development protein 2-like protein [Willisornis vidua]|uniref:Craniofacial development protein 2-like protein n=1 Tax=Willisornis vidua TaxID=1566151 RepID=A0ABQ9D3Z5_9PASS|nr:craniofacial development protein 2-like protein [Willisornis vidua]